MHIENAYIVKSFKHVSIQKQVHLQLPGMFIVLKLKKLNKRIYMYICVTVIENFQIWFKDFFKKWKKN